MRPADLDASASAPPAASSCPSGQAAAARGRARLGRWLRELLDLGVALVMEMTEIAGDRRTMRHGVTAHVDLRLGWALVARAMRWTRMLQARLAAEAKAAKAEIAAAEAEAETEGQAWRAVREIDHDGPEHIGQLGFMPPEPPIPAMPADPEIDGKPMEEVVERICACLDGAAELIGAHWAKVHIMAVAREVRAVLGRAAPAPDVGVARDGARDATDRTADGGDEDGGGASFGAAPPRAPDSG